MAVLLALLGGTILLYWWSRSADPRFYRFLKTRPGMLLSDVFGWRYTIGDAVVVGDKPESEMTPEELAVKRELEGSVAAYEPTHRLVLTNMKYMEGELAGEEGDYVNFIESYGDGGSLAVKVAKARIDRIEELTPDVPEITYRDIRFRLEFPQLSFYKHPPYSILTDENYFRVERSVNVLQHLHSEFLAWFEPVIDESRELGNIQLLFFSDEAAFTDYQKKFVPHMKGALGFYSIAMDRFILFNEKGSEFMKDLTGGLEEADGGDAAVPDERRARVRIKQRLVERSLQHDAEERTFTTLRHEGAHQLFFTYGVHSAERMENDWLVEGLATFCESRRIGNAQPARLGLLRAKLRDDDIIPLSRLVNFRHPSGFMGLGGDDKVELAYCEAWSLVGYLLERKRGAFFDFMRFLRAPENFNQVVRTPHMKILCGFLETDPEALTADWTAYVRGM